MSASRPRLSALAGLPLAGIVLLAAALRLWTLDAPALWWDEGLNAYLAPLPPGRLLAMSNAVLDSNPPTYRLLLGAWMRLAGPGAVSLRLPSVLYGLATVVVAYAWGRWMGGATVGLLAALLMALNPMAIYRQREAKAYPLVALCAALSCYLWLRYILSREHRRWLPWVAYTLCTSLAIGSHYYALFVCAAQGLGLIVWLVMQRIPRREAVAHAARWLVTQACAIGVWVPWVALSYQAAWGGAAEAGVGRASLGLLGYGREVAVSLVAGPRVAGRVALLAVVAAAMAAIWALASLRREPSRDEKTRGWCLTTLIAVPLLLGYLAQRVLSFMDARFFFYVTTPLAMLMALGLARLRWAAVPLGLALLAAWTVALPSARGAYCAPEDDLRPLAASVQRYVCTGDAVIVAYIWQEGILRMYAPEVDAHYELGWYTAETVGPGVEALLARHGRVWLVSFNVPLQDPTNTAGWWLEQNAVRTYYQAAGNNHLAGYVRCPGSQTTVAEAAFGEELTLEYAPVSSAATVGDAVCVPLAWRVSDTCLADYAVFVHLADALGRPWAQSDGAPQQGLRGFQTIAVGERVLDPRALLVTSDIPSGEYRLLVGVYRRQDGQRLRVSRGTQAGSDSVQVGTVLVTGG